MALALESKKNLLVLLLLILAGGLAVAYFVLAPKFSQESPEVSEARFYYRLLSSNSDFSLGENLFSTRDYQGARDAYREALKKAQTPAEEGQILYKLALAERYSDQPLIAIPLFKEIAAHPDYPSTTRAYAVQAMGQAYYAFNDPAITAEIFKDSPYKEMSAPGNVRLSYRKLFEYASSFYPLGIPETRVAQWYAQELADAGPSVDPALREEYKNIIRQKLDRADADIVRTTEQPERGASYQPEILTRKAYILGMLSVSGDESLGDPGAAFAKALERAKISLDSEAQAKYYYAVFLSSKYGNTRSADIQNLLRDFYATNRYEKTGIVRFIRNEADDKVKEKNVLILAENDPEFKNWLVLLGWKAF